MNDKPTVKIYLPLHLNGESTFENRDKIYKGKITNIKARSKRTHFTWRRVSTEVGRKETLHS